jgi:GntR family transcriptional regulator
MIISGKLESGEALPSIRSLAKDLRISVITTKRAYDELEREGYIDTIPGKGCFVATRGVELLREENLMRIEEHMQEVARLAVSINLTNEDLMEMFRTLLSEAD